MAEVSAGVVEGLGRAPDLRGAHQPHRAIAQVAILEQHEDRQQQRQRCSEQRWNGFPRVFEQQEQRRLRILRDLDLQRLAVVLRIDDLLLDAAQRRRGPLPDSGRSQLEMQEPRLVAQIRFVLRQFLEKLGHLAARDGRPAEQRRQQGGDHDRDGEPVRKTDALEASHQRGEHESQQSGERERNQEVLAGVEPRDEQRGDDHARGAVHHG